MIIGHGDIASALIDRADWIYFASGVSNSRETEESEYTREEKLLLSQDTRKHIVYFSSLSIFYSDSRYAQHKKHMEDLIKKHFKHYTIVRIGNITWGTNPHTLINHFKKLIEKGEDIEIWDTHRYLINKEEFQHWLSLIPDWNCEMNLTGTKLSVADIVKRLTTNGHV